MNYSQPQLNFLQQAYDSLSESVYASLVLQTRLKPYLDQLELVIDPATGSGQAGIRLDATGLNQMLADRKASDPENTLADLLDLDRYAGGFLSGTHWLGLVDFDSLIETLPQTAGNDDFYGEAGTDTYVFSRWLTRYHQIITVRLQGLVPAAAQTRFGMALA